VASNCIVPFMGNILFLSSYSGLYPSDYEYLRTKKIRQNQKEHLKFGCNYEKDLQYHDDVLGRFLPNL
jgi:hypothetical protein